MDIPSEVYDAMESMIKTVVRKEKKRLASKKYRENNKEKCRLYRKEYNKEYKKNNKEYFKIYYKNNIEKYRESVKKYDKTDKGKLYRKQYRQTDKGKKIKRIGDWKHMGLICDDYNSLYEKVYSTTNCEECDVLLTEDKKTTKTTRCMDHDHTTGLFRNVLCHSCNVKRG